MSSIFDSLYILSAGLEFFFALISVILLLGCLLDHDKKRKTNQLMIALLIVHAAINIVDACVWIWCDVPSLLTLMKILSFLSYALGSAVVILFSLLLIVSIREYTSVPKWIYSAVFLTGACMTVLWIISIFNGMYYYWDENGVCNQGDLFWLSQAFGILFFAFDIGLVLHYRRFLKKKDTAVLILYSAIPLISFIFVFLWDVTPFYMATTIVLLLYYIVIHVEHGQRIAEQETKLLKQELELTNSRTAVVLTQVRPHFLYNSLTAIAQLCEKNPELAKKTTLNFSEYLRQNMSYLDQKVPILFSKELEHIKNYLAIEKVRFGDALSVEYKIEATDFYLPPLTLQPIVENAVKHGVGMKEDGGTVTVSSKKLSGFYEVSVTDDGVGFDSSHIAPEGTEHVGLKLVRTRLETLVGADMRVESHPGEGTTVTISIPQNEALSEKKE